MARRPIPLPLVGMGRAPDTTRARMPGPADGRSPLPPRVRFADGPEEPLRAVPLVDLHAFGVGVVGAGLNACTPAPMQVSFGRRPEGFIMGR